LAVIFISLSALIKPIGLILLPVTALSHYQKNNNLLNSLGLIGSGFLVYLLGILPYFHLDSYRYYALFADQIGKSTFAGISIASGTQIPWFFIAYLFALYLYWQQKINSTNTYLAVILSSLVFTHFHPQWLVWITPVFIFYIIKNNRLPVWLIVLGAWFFVLLSFDDTMLVQAFLHSNLSLAWLRRISFFDLAVQASRAALVVTFLSSLFYEKHQLS
jgi:hypothetical protein